MKDINIKEIESKYEITRDGKIINKNNNKEQKGSITNSGYIRVIFFGDRVSLHRVIATKFVQRVGNRDYVNHIDGNKLNNRADNLEWCTSSENAKHAFNLGLRAPISNPKYGEDNHLSTLTEKQVREIIKLVDIPFGEIAKRYDTSKSTIRHIFKGRSWQHLNLDLPKEKTNHRLKMNLKEARIIRAKLVGGARQADVAREYGVDKGIISKIARNVTWREPQSNP